MTSVGLDRVGRALRRSARLRGGDWPDGRAGLIATFLILGLTTPVSARVFAQPIPGPIDKAATRETRALFTSMRRLATRGAMFGHQATLEYGYRWAGDPDRSDVADVTGKFPAVYGLDVAGIFAKGDPDRVDPARAATVRGHVREAYSRGGVISFSWHMPNPVNDTDSWNTTPAVAAMLPGGALAADYRAKLDLVSAFFRSLTDARGRAIPVWFRPFHEMTGSWFWWGKGNATCADYAALWRLSVEHLRARRVRNVLWAYSTDVFDGANDYFACYPGDAYVDLLGFDDYHSIKIADTRALFVRRLRDVVRWAGERGKIAALTETGVEAVPDPRWWTDVLLTALKDAPGISYALVWRNANFAREKRNHFFAPYPGQKSAANFVVFERDPWTLFEPDLPRMYDR